MSEVLGNPFQNRRIGKRGFEVITQLAMDTMDGVNTPEEALMAIRRMFQATENLDVVTLQTRMWFARMAKQAAKYSRALDMNPNDPVALVEFGRSMTYLFNMAEELTGTSANTARNLAAHRIEVVGDEVITAAASRANPEDLVKAREVIQKTRERVSKKTAKKARERAEAGRGCAEAAGDRPQAVRRGPRGPSTGPQPRDP
jgi:hypothetical protein